MIFEIVDFEIAFFSQGKGVRSTSVREVVEISKYLRLRTMHGVESQSWEQLAGRV